MLDFTLLRVGGLTITVGSLIAAGITILLTWVAIVVVKRALAKYAERHPNINSASFYTVTRLLQYAMLVIGALIALSMIGISLDKFALIAGALGVGLGFGLQAIFSNFISGLVLLFDRSLKVGDFVELDGDVRGVVRAISMRATRITTNDNIDILVPNSEFVTGRVVNWTYRSVNRRLRLEFSATYGVDKELVKKAALEAAAKVPFTLTMDGPRQPQVWLVGFGDYRAEYVLAVWLTEEAARRNAVVKAAYLWELDTALRKYGIAIPLPQRDLHLRSVFGLEGDRALAALRGALLAGGDGSAQDSGGPPGGEREMQRVASELDSSERASLSRNDAQQDTEREIREDVEREEADRAEAQQARDGNSRRRDNDER